MANAEAAEARRLDDEAVKVSPNKDEDFLLRDLHADLLVYKHERANWNGKGPRGEKVVNDAHQKLLDACVEYLISNHMFLEPEQVRALGRSSKVEAEPKSCPECAAVTVWEIDGSYGIKGLGYSVMSHKSPEEAVAMYHAAHTTERRKADRRINPTSTLG